MQLREKTQKTPNMEDLAVRIALELYYDSAMTKYDPKDGRETLRELIRLALKNIESTRAEIEAISSPFVDRYLNLIGEQKRFYRPGPANDPQGKREFCQRKNQFLAEVKEQAEYFFFTSSKELQENLGSYLLTRDRILAYLSTVKERV